MPLKLILLLSIFLLSFPSCYASKLTPQKSAIATAHPLATQAGEDILRQGGNAFDAAVAITAALAVVEPYSSGLGGGGFWMLHQSQENKTIFLDGREKAPLAAHRDMYLDEQGNYIKGSSVNGALAAGIPGTVAAMVKLAENYGRLPLSTSIQSAINYAQNGFKVTKHYKRMINFRKQTIRQSSAAAAVFLDNNEVPELGHIIRQPDLANTLKSISQHGNDGFYQGPVAEKLVEGVRQAGGIWSLEDLAAYKVVEREPIQFKFQDLIIYSAPPPSSGGIALNEILNILSLYKLEKLPNSQRIHIIVEAMRRAYRDRAEYLGDSDFVNIPITQLTSPDYAAGLAVTIHPQQNTPSSSLAGYQHPSGGNDTTHFAVMDQYGNSVSATMSINYPFGSGFIPPGTGILLNDEMDDFAAKPGVPNVYGLVGAEANSIIAEKRPLSSMSPSYIESPHGTALIGTPGGSRIITMVLLAILELKDSFNPQDWVDLPRFHHQYLPDVIQYEKAAFEQKLIDALQAKGHQLKPVNEYGNMQAIWWDYKSGQVNSASDRRGEGYAKSFKVQ